jgi:hypothetical protein
LKAELCDGDGDGGGDDDDDDIDDNEFRIHAPCVT